MNVINNDKAKEEKAKFEDVLTELLYSKYKTLVFHGGTAIWRCYNGNRFSRDIDLYYNARGVSAKECYKEFTDFFEGKKFTIKSKSYNNNTKTMQFLVEAVIKMKVDINLNYRFGIPEEYSRVDGSKIIVLALTPLKLLNEKINAYKDKISNFNAFRQPEVQDLYDIYYLTTIIKRDAKTADRLTNLLQSINGNPPPNIRSLQSLILFGIAPTFEFMMKSIRAWIK